MCKKKCEKKDTDKLPYPNEEYVVKEFKRVYDGILKHETKAKSALLASALINIKENDIAGCGSVGIIVIPGIGRKGFSAAMHGAINAISNGDYTMIENPLDYTDKEEDSVKH